MILNVCMHVINCTFVYRLLYLSIIDNYRCQKTTDGILQRVRTNIAPSLRVAARGRRFRPVAGGGSLFSQPQVRKGTGFVDPSDLPESDEERRSAVTM